MWLSIVKEGPLPRIQQRDTVEGDYKCGKILRADYLPNSTPAQPNAYILLPLQCCSHIFKLHETATKALIQFSMIIGQGATHAEIILIAPGDNIMGVLQNILVGF